MKIGGRIWNKAVPECLWLVVQRWLCGFYFCDRKMEGGEERGWRENMQEAGPAMEPGQDAKM